MNEILWNNSFADIHVDQLENDRPRMMNLSNQSLEYVANYFHVSAAMDDESLDQIDRVDWHCCTWLEI